MAQKSFSKPKPKPVKPNRQAQNKRFKKLANTVKVLKKGEKS